MITSITDAGGYCACAAYKMTNKTACVGMAILYGNYFVFLLILTKMYTLDVTAASTLGLPNGREGDFTKSTFRFGKYGKMSRVKRSHSTASKSETENMDGWIHSINQTVFVLPQFEKFCKLSVSFYDQHNIYECRPSSLWLDSDTQTLKKIKSTFLYYEIAVIKNAKMQWSIPENVTDLRLWYQKIAIIQSDAFADLQHLKSLHLEHNVISYVSRRAFTSLTKLKELNLSFNKIQALPSCLFQRLPNLKTLSLENNELEFIKRRTLAGLESLTSLDLSSNAIEEIHKDAFLPLHFAGNIIITLHKNCLKYPRKEWIRIESYPYQDICSHETALTASKKNFLKKLNHFNNFMENLNTTEKASSNTKGKAERTGVANSKAIRVLSAEDNPWQCICPLSDNTLQYIMHVADLFHKQSYLRSTNCPASQNCTENKMSIYWSIIMPCADIKYDIGKPAANADVLLRNCCISTNTLESDERNRSCQMLTNILKPNQTGRVSSDNDKIDNKEMTENHITMIGIIIVIICPILLTLCPDCHKSVGPTSDFPPVGSGRTYGNQNNSNKLVETRKPHCGSQVISNRNSVCLTTTLDASSSMSSLTAVSMFERKSMDTSSTSFAGVSSRLKNQ
ncbi:uncharacterized protein LOC143452186 [Clavelina lepadiformis]|uniref:uncharacterized protein LOC143452186 n=1 Tax=Clavelina lepadiformis TaxID=159417 RepID=UPI00404213E1